MSAKEYVFDKRVRRAVSFGSLPKISGHHCLDVTPAIVLPAIWLNDLQHFGADPFRKLRKQAVAEREAWAAIGKGADKSARRWAKHHLRVWQQRERACTLMVEYFEADRPQPNYHWPIELAPSVDWACIAVFAAQNMGRPI